MKIGILTFHCAHNYGAVLQAYATQEQLKKMGHEVEIIDYRPEYLVDPYKYQFTMSEFRKNGRNTIITWIKRNLVRFYYSYFTQQKAKGFNLFVEKFLNLSTEPFSAPFSSNLQYDCYLMGSDQVWNSKITRKKDNLFFGNFIVKEGAKKIAYAASTPPPIHPLPMGERVEWSSRLQNFSAISVREIQLQNFLSNQLSIRSEVVLDPTLMIDNSIWRKMSIPPTINQKYVLVYTLGGVGNDAIRMAKQIAKQIGAITVSLSSMMSFDRDVYTAKATPEEFVGWFQEASFVITSSFHGTAFSILFHKSFYSILRGSEKDTRIVSLLSNLALLDRAVQKSENIEFKDINYSTALPLLDKMQQDSISFIEKSL